MNVHSKRRRQRSIFKPRRLTLEKLEDRLALSLVAAYSFNEGSGPSLADNSGNGLNGTISGAAWSASGKYGGALSFDGNNDWVTVNDDNRLDLTSGMTLEAWVFPTAAAGVRDVLIKEGNNVDIYNLYARIGNGAPQSNVFVNGSNRSAEGAPLPLNTWSHLAGTYDGSTLRLFVNGTQVASNNVAGSIGMSNGPLRIGGNSLWGEFFAGRIDEVRIYNHALSQGEIQVDMNIPVGDTTDPTPHPTPLVYAGPDMTIDLGNAALLNGEAISNTLQGLTMAWSLVSGPGTVSYGNSNSPVTTAQFSAAGVYELQLTVSNAFATGSDRVVITVQSDNAEEVIVTNSPLSLAEGATATINSARLTTTDNDNTAAQLIYTITSGPNNGTVRLNGSATTTFTQADINAGRVTYLHNGSEGASDSFGFRVNDAEGPGTSGTFNINVTPVNDEQVLSTNSPLTAIRGATTTITSSQLRTTDVDNTASQLTYTITTGPTRGTLRRSGTATTTFTQADINAGLITYVNNGNAATSDSFSFTVNDGQGTSTSGTFSISVIDATQATFTDSFEGTPPYGWDDEWHATGPANHPGLSTTDEVAPPPGGGTRTLRQWWSASPDVWPEWLAYEISPDEGDVLEFEYYLKYDANFNANNTYIKSIIGRAGSNQELYINSHVPGGALGVLFQQVSPAGNWMYSNRNGNLYSMPNGEWVHFRWQIKISTESSGDPRSGYLYGWVNGTKRWEYDNINTIHSGQYSELNLNSTFNATIYGPNQKRYWDLFKLTVNPGGGSVQSLTTASFPNADAAGGGNTVNGLRQSLTFTRSVRRDHAIPSTPSNLLLTVDDVENESSQFHDTDGALQNDHDRDSVFDGIGEFGFDLEESWLNSF